MTTRSSSRQAAKAQTKTSARFLWRAAYRTGPRRFLLALGLPIISALLALPQLWLMAFLLTVILTPSLRATSPFIALGLIAALMLLRLLLDYLAARLSAQAAAAARVVLRNRIYSHLLHEGPAFTQQREVGALTTSLIERIEAIDGYISRYLPQRAVLAVVPLGFLICFACFDWMIAAFLALTLLVLPVFFAIFGIAAHRANVRQFGTLERMSGLFLDRLRQLTLLRIMGAVEREAATLRQAADEFRLRTMLVLRLAFLSSAALDFVIAFGIVIVALRVGLHLKSVPPGLSLHEGIFLLLATVEFFGPIRAIVASYHDRATALAAAHPLIELIEAPQTHLVGRRPLPEAARQLPLEFRAISYAYPGRGGNVLSAFNLRIEAGEFIAIAGPSGAGKSTLLALLLGFIRADEGALLLGDELLDALESEARASLFSWVGQRTHVFYGTLYENIRLGVAGATEEQVYAAAVKAGLGDVLHNLPEGLHTLIGERGFGLSGGQAQRVALARAFLRNTPFLLLDEPTTGLDLETATALMETICELALDRSVILVSHDPLALRYAARTITLEGGVYAAA